MKHQNKTLDPQNWEDFREFGHKVFDEMVDYLESIRQRPAWQSPDEDKKQNFQSSLPQTPQNIESVYDEVKQKIMPYPTGNIHPRFWGWVLGCGTADTIISDMIASTINCHVSGYDQAANYVEKEVIRWLAEIVDFPQETSGLLVSGGTVASLIGLATARNNYELSEVDIRKEGVSSERKLTVYASEATHGWIGRACDLLGLGSNAFRAIPVDNCGEVCLESMDRQIASDIESGFSPFCIVGTAGTVGIGANDDFNGLSELARKYNLWFHVDGAFGAMVKLSPKYRYLVEGMEKADSIAYDLHKWGYLQYEVACILIKDANKHNKAFSFAPSYLAKSRAGIATDPTEFAEKGIQLSRGFRALKVWMALKVHGVEKFGELIEQNINQAFYLSELINKHHKLEILSPATTNVVCFRFLPDDISAELLNKFNQELLIQIHESGIAVPSNAIVRNSFAIRVCITNHRTKFEDLDLFVDTLLRLGNKLENELIKDKDASYAIQE